MAEIERSWVVQRAASRASLLQQCVSALDGGLLVAGQRLPDERSIADRSGLSRSTVRLVLDALERQGRITRQVGRGTYVAEQVRIGGLDSATLATPAELMEFRLVTEPSLVELVVLKATDARLAQLAEIAAAGAGVEQWQEAEAADRAFHQALFEATANSYFMELGQRLSRARDSRSWQQLKEMSFSRDKWALYHRDHEAIAAALMARDAQGARNGLRLHLGGVRANAQKAAGDI